MNNKFIQLSNFLNEAFLTNIEKWSWQRGKDIEKLKKEILRNHGEWTGYARTLQKNIGRLSNLIDREVVRK